MPFGRIYLVTNTLNGKRYVGQTTNTLRSRWTAHKAASRRGSAIPFHQAIRKYGENTFRVTELSLATCLDDLNELEILYIRGLNTITPNGYNRDSGGRNYSTHPETKAKIGAANKGRPSPLKGKKHRPESIEKMRFSQKGKPCWIKGKSHSEETKRKLSASRQGKPGILHTEEFKQKLSRRNRGNTYSLGLRRSDEWREGQREFAVARERRPNGTFKKAGEL